MTSLIKQTPNKVLNKKIINIDYMMMDWAVNSGNQGIFSLISIQTYVLPSQDGRAVEEMQHLSLFA